MQPIPMVSLSPPRIRLKEIPDISSFIPSYFSIYFNIGRMLRDHFLVFTLMDCSTRLLLWFILS